MTKPQTRQMRPRLSSWECSGTPIPITLYGRDRVKCSIKYRETDTVFGECGIELLQLAVAAYGVSMLKPLKWQSTFAIWLRQYINPYSGNS